MNFMKLKYILINFIILSSSLFLSGCMTIVATGAYIDYKKNHWEGNLVGSRFQLIQDVYLYEYTTKIGVFL